MPFTLDALRKILCISLATAVLGKVNGAAEISTFVAPDGAVTVSTPLLFVTPVDVFKIVPLAFAKRTVKLLLAFHVLF